MESPLALAAATLFVLLVAGLLAALLAGLAVTLRRAGLPESVRRARIRTVALGLIGWLLICTALAASGILHQWQALPPRLLLVFVPPVLFAVWLCRSAAVGQLLDHAPRAAMVYLQSFRILMEVILWMLFLARVLPVQMTFEGRNFDILVGLTAPLVAWFGLRSWPRWLLAAWHVASLLVLTNIVTIAILSAPLPFRQFLNEPANTAIAYWPFVWLPGFVVPVAYSLHLLALRQLTREKITRPVAAGVLVG